MNSPRGDGGQAAVELALVLPLLTAMLLLVVQVGLLVRDEVLLVHAAREAVREVAVREVAVRDGPSTPSDATLARRVALRATGGALRPEALAVDVSQRAGRVAVRASYRAELHVPIVDWAARYVQLAAFAEMQREID